MSSNRPKFRKLKSAMAAVLLAVGLFLSTSQFQVCAASADDFIRPWESRPYEVKVWLCNNGTPEIAAVLPSVSEDIARRTEIIDPSAWRVNVLEAPSNWNMRILNTIESAEQLDDFAKSEALTGVDKLIAICLTNSNGSIRYRVREFDVQTGQWGALIDRYSANSQNLGSNLFSAIQRAFMPLARIDRVSESGEVFVRARAVNACVKSDIHGNEPSPIEFSPVWIRPSDRFLPIIRRVDRNGDLAGLEPIEFTYLTINSQEGSRLVCNTHSRQRSALGGRSSKRAQKLALVIRPPESSTRLKLVSRGDDSHPLSGYEIYSRRPEATKNEESEFLGTTDWRGMIEIPPFEEGLRLIYVKHGSAALLKLPIIPGLYDEVVTAVPDDEARLNAEGIANGFQIEILNNVAQRELFKSQIMSAVQKKQIDEARLLMEKFQRLETPQKLKIRMANEESKLKNSTTNKRERARIVGMFQQLNTLANKNVNSSMETELQAAIQAVAK